MPQHANAQAHQQAGEGQEGPADASVQRQHNQQKRQRCVGLLPEVSAHGGCMLAPGQCGLRGQEALRELLMRALATTPDSRAADAFIAAVGSLLANVHLRCTAAAAGSGSSSGDGNDGWAADGGSVSAGGSATAPSTTKSAPGSTSVLQRVRSALAKPASADSLGEHSAGADETSGLHVEPSESASMRSADSSPFESSGSAWRVSPPLQLRIVAVWVDASRRTVTLG
jgi:hypothetical protein